MKGKQNSLCPRSKTRVEQTDDAISPVVGIMLLIVVTVIIAAMVAAFAGGLSATQEKAPSTVLSVEISASNADDMVKITSMSGEELPTKDMKIVTTYVVPEKNGDTKVTEANVGKVIKHTIDGTLDIKDNQVKTDIVGYPFTPQTTIPKDRVAGPILSQGVGSYFGTNVMKAGQTIQISRLEFLGFNVKERTKYGFGEGAVVHVTITHIPSNKVIYDKDVIATW